MVFANIAGGTFFAILFFALVFFAAVTSAIALLEVCASFAIDSLGWERKHAALVIGTAITLLGIPSALSFGVLSDVTILNQSVFDFAGLVTDNILMPLGGLTMCYYVAGNGNRSIYLRRSRRTVRNSVWENSGCSASDS